MTTADSIVFGAAGFIGRAVVAELLRDGRTVVAGVRAGSQGRLTSWLAAQDVDQSGLRLTTVDITQPNLGLAEEFDGIRDVYNTAALMQFGLGAEQARSVNLTGALEVARWASGQPQLRRLVHISGYRTTVGGGGGVDYRAGAYEASKTEADSALRTLAKELDVPLTIANPASVIGPGQYFGLSDLIHNLWLGKLPVLPGDRDTFVPIVGIDYVAQFLARVPALPGTADRAYTLLDPATPNLPELVRLVATHLRVPAPRFTIPVGIVRALPRALTNADPESLAFIAGDRYDTTATDVVARELGIEHPPVGDLLRAYADGVVATRNGAASTASTRHSDRKSVPAPGFHDGTWLEGDRETPEYVLLHGLPLNSAGWSEITAALDASVLAADLPGVGRSAPRSGTADLPDPGRSAALGEWTEQLMTPVRSRPILVGHSLGTQAAVEYALRHPDRLARLVLIAPYFLQQRPSWVRRSPLAAVALKWLSSAKLAEQLGVPDGPAVVSAAADLGRPGVAHRTIAALAAVSTSAHRAELADKLARVRVPVHIVVGSADPLVVSTTHPVTTIEGAGHYPQLTHPALLADLLVREKTGEPVSR
ncbi:alpha/beta fold hydrolase [Nocardia huaxiensis]|uniref:alpha/beta fold hydrolase n=1 Tax=Nocardia huaxiensis TaxID=2755382 RepID=UPI001E52C01C|nr:alpha/beta fold hydrolase [Nocardia huaxiensis]UFS96306.1 alpha/beta fold hydrolase [Nocardia huaxiensis]